MNNETIDSTVVTYSGKLLRQLAYQMLLKEGDMIDKNNFTYSNYYFYDTMSSTKNGYPHHPYLCPFAAN